MDALDGFRQEDRGRVAEMIGAISIRGSFDLDSIVIRTALLSRIFQGSSPNV